MVDFKSVFESLPGLILVLSPEFKILAASDFYVNAMFVSRKKLIGKDVSFVFHEKNKKKTDSAYYQNMLSLQWVLKNKTAQSIAVVRNEVRRPDGKLEERYWSTINKPVLNSKGQVIYLIHRIEDVTEVFVNDKRKRKSVSGAEIKPVDAKTEIAKRSLEIQDRNRELLDRLSERTIQLENINRNLADYKYALNKACIIVFTDNKGIILYVNDNFCEVSKFARAELIGKKHNLINSGYHSKTFFKELWKTIQQGKVWKGEIRNRAKDGTIFWTDSKIIPFLDEKGNPIRHLAIYADVTKRVLSQEKLRISEENYKGIYENTLVAMITSDGKTTKPIMVNHVGAQLFGYKTKEEFLTRFDPSFHYVDPEVRASNVEKVKTEGEVGNLVVKMRKLDGTVFWVKMFVKLNRAKTRAQTVIVDITQQVRAQEMLSAKIQELEITNNELESFNYISTHDLQEPLRKIKNFASVLIQSRETIPTGEKRFYLQRMSETAEQMQALIEDLITYSKIRNEVRNFEKTELRAIVVSVKANFHNALKEKKAKIKCGRLCTVPVLRFQFHLLISNLLSNSLKFQHPKRAPLIILQSETDKGIVFNQPKLSPQERYCHIIYRDNSLGFDPQYNDRIFEIFERLHPNEAYKGTGMGLAICKRIVENHNGFITAKGKPNKGVQFDIYLPVKNK